MNVNKVENNNNYRTFNYDRKIARFKKVFKFL